VCPRDGIVPSFLPHLVTRAVVHAEHMSEPSTSPTSHVSGYPRSAGSPRGEARRQALLELVTDDLAVNGLVGFSLRRAAKAAGTTHKVLLYHFDGVEDLLAQSVAKLRDRRISSALAAATGAHEGDTLAERARAVWPALRAEAEGARRTLDQAMGLAMYDPDRFAPLGREASAQYLPSLLSICPVQWEDSRKLEVASMMLAAFRGFLLDWVLSGDSERVNGGVECLLRALEREERAGDV
jgi:AcrR family transcriptional regulator